MGRIDMISTIKERLREDKTEEALLLLQNRHDQNKLETIKLLGMVYSQHQDEVSAIKYFSKYLEKVPNDQEVLLWLAQSKFAAGYNAVNEFSLLTTLTQNPDVWHGYALALAGSGEVGRSIDYLRQKLEEYPNWVEGHKIFSKIKFTQGGQSEFDESFKIAVRLSPQNEGLIKEYFSILVQNKCWDQASALIDEFAKLKINTPFINVARVHLDLEHYRAFSRSKLNRLCQGIDSATLDLALVRHFIRQKQYSKAESIALKRVAKSSALVFIPYLSTIWRVTGSKFLSWLEGEPKYISQQSLSQNNEQLLQLSALLKKLHTAKGPLLEQSIRGGTQTDQNLFLRHESEIQSLKQSVKFNVKNFVATLPNGDHTHPLLGKNYTEILNGNIKFTGSWSVFLKPQGRNIPHTHPKGWISSALYLQLPDKTKTGAKNAGAIQFGVPPEDLELNLSPTHTITPKLGDIVLFPSTMWHSTTPFKKGERLVVAFDVQAPKIYR